MSGADFDSVLSEGDINVIANRFSQFRFGEVREEMARVERRRAETMEALETVGLVFEGNHVATPDNGKLTISYKTGERRTIDVMPLLVKKPGENGEPVVHTVFMPINVPLSELVGA